MSTYYNGSLNGFWTGHSDMRPKSKALSPSSDRGVETMGHTVKLGFKAQIGLEVLCRTYIYIKKKKKVRFIIIIIILSNWNMVIGWKFMIEAMGKGSFFL